MRQYPFSGLQPPDKGMFQIRNLIMSVGHFHAHGDPNAARLLLQRAKSSSKFRDYVYGARYSINRDYDIPYLAGYSIDGRVIFVDRHLPISLLIGGARINIIPFLVTHERTEKGILDVFGVKYNDAHAAATLEEHGHLKSAHVSPSAYERALDPYIKADQHEKILRVPAVLDLKPYRDSRDLKLIERMKAKMINGH